MFKNKRAMGAFTIAIGSIVFSVLPGAVFAASSSSVATVLVNTTGGTASSSDFTVSVTGGSPSSFTGSASGTIVTLPASTTFTITESSSVANYTTTFTGTGCSNQNCTASLAADATSTFTITNTFNPPAATSTPTSTPADPNNLIQNPFLSNQSPSNGFAPNPAIVPTHWQASDYGDAAAASTTFTYPAANWTGLGSGENVRIANYPTGGSGGDAKWVFENVPVTPGAGYTYTDNYISNATSYIAAAIPGNPLIATLPSSNGAIATATATFFAPINATSVTLYHILNSNGSLTTGNFSLKLTTPANQNLFSQGIVTLTFDDGWQSQYDNARSILAGTPSSFYIITNTMVNGGESLFNNFLPQNQINVTTNCDGNAGDFCAATSTRGAAWSNIYTDPNGHSFTFIDSYSSTATSTVSVTYTPNGGSQTTQTLATLTSTGGISKNFTNTFTLPVLASSSPINILHQSANGTTTIATASLNENGGVDVNGYMTTQEVQTLQADGHEMSAHTLDHCNLAMLDANPASANTGGTQGPPAGACATALNTSTTAMMQIDSSRAALINASLSPVDTFAYPYGGNNANAATLLKQDGFIGSRTSDPGYNYLTSNPYTLTTQVIDASTTFDPNGLQKVKGWIDAADSGHAWLILLLHQVESSSTININHDIDGTTPDFLQQIVTYLKSKNTISVATMHSVLTQYYNLASSPSASVAPVATPAAGTYTAAQTVSLFSQNALSVRYTKDGSTPTCSLGTIYANPIAVTTSTDIKAIGCNSTGQSSVADFNYTLSLTPPLSINPATVANGTVGISYLTTLTASTTATGTFNWSIATGTLPTGLILNTSSTGATTTISGIPTSNGSSTFSIKTMNDVASSTQAYTLLINPAIIATSTPTSTPISTSSITLTPSSFPDPTVGSFYSQTIKASDVIATDTFIWKIGTSTLPSEFTITTSTTSITIAGTASSTGIYQLTVRASSNNTSTSTQIASTTLSYTLKVDAAPAPAPAAVGTSGGGGGGGGGGEGFYIPPTTNVASTSTTGIVLGASSTNTLALLQSLLAQLISLEKQLVKIKFKQNGCPAIFSKNLSQGMTDTQVKNLQKVLNYTFLTQVAVSGTGSAGHESIYFGGITKTAVTTFQNIFASDILTPNGLTAGNGYVGAATRAELNKLCSQ